MKVFDIVIFIIVLILLGLAGGYAARSASLMSQNLHYGQDPRVASARSLLIWSSIMTFMAVGVTIVVLVLFFIFGEGVTAGTRKYIILGLGIFLFIWVFISGILAAVGTNRFKKTASYSGTGTDVTAYNNAIAATVILLLGMTILFIIWLLIFLLRKPKRIEKIQETIDEVQEKLVKGVKDAKKAIVETKGSAATKVKDILKIAQNEAVEIIATAEETAREIVDLANRDVRDIFKSSERDIVIKRDLEKEARQRKITEMSEDPEIYEEVARLEARKAPSPRRTSEEEAPVIATNVPPTPPPRAKASPDRSRVSTRRIRPLDEPLEPEKPATNGGRVSMRARPPPEVVMEPVSPPAKPRLSMRPVPPRDIVTSEKIVTNGSKNGSRASMRARPDVKVDIPPVPPPRNN